MTQSDATDLVWEPQDTWSWQKRIRGYPGQWNMMGWLDLVQLERGVVDEPIEVQRLTLGAFCRFAACMTCERLEVQRPSNH